MSVDTGKLHGPRVTLRTCEVYNANGWIIDRRRWLWFDQAANSREAQDRCCEHRARRLMHHLDDAAKAVVSGDGFYCWYDAYPRECDDPERHLGPAPDVEATTFQLDLFGVAS
jgi:hypothetical protein